MKVLVIDDDDMLRRLAALTLARVGGLDVVEAPGGEIGVEKARAERPDVILLDVHMPGLDGPATLARLGSDPATASIPVVFLTGTASPAELERLRTLGAKGVLTKPFDPRSLPAQLARLLEQPS